MQSLELLKVIDTSHVISIKLIWEAFSHAKITKLIFSSQLGPQWHSYRHIRQLNEPVTRAMRTEWRQYSFETVVKGLELSVVSCTESLKL